MRVITVRADQNSAEGRLQQDDLYHAVACRADDQYKRWGQCDAGLVLQVAKDRVGCWAAARLEGVIAYRSGDCCISEESTS